MVLRRSASVFFVLFTCFGLLCSEDMCLGSKCECTEYPVRIICNDGHPDIINNMVKRHAVSLDVYGDSVASLLMIKLSEYVSLKTLEIHIQDPDVCLWASHKRKQFTRINITTPKLCEYIRNIGHNRLDDTTDSVSSEPNGELEQETKDTFIQIRSSDLLFLFIICAFMSLCGVLRPCLR